MKSCKTSGTLAQCADPWQLNGLCFDLSLTCYKERCRVHACENGHCRWDTTWLWFWWNKA